MKIISGIHKGRVLKGYDLVNTRPTMARVKESLFGMIFPYLKDSVVLDLFAGSGNLGIESLSNGAKEIYLVDNCKKANLIQQENYNNLNLENTNIIMGDYKNVLKEFYTQNKKFDIIFLDPPYSSNYIEEAIKLINNYELLNTNGIIVCESDNFDKVVYNNLECIKTKKYGEKHIVILRK